MKWGQNIFVKTFLPLNAMGINFAGKITYKLASIIAQYTFFLVINHMRIALSSLNINQKSNQRYILYDKVTLYR